MTILLLRIAMVLIAAAAGGMAPCVGNHHVWLLYFRGGFRGTRCATSRYDADAGNTG